MAEKKWNPRYVLWAKSNGNTPEVQATKDGHWFEGEFTPSMMEFMFWVQQKWREWAQDLGFVRPHAGESAVRIAQMNTPNYQEHFDSWLTKKVIP